MTTTDRNPHRAGVLTPKERAFYEAAMDDLDRARVPFLVGGAYALAQYTGIERHTKDFDIFVRRGSCDDALEALRQAGHEVETTFPHWLGKARQGEHFIDLIYASGNGVACVDQSWFEHAEEG